MAKTQPVTSAALAAIFNSNKFPTVNAQVPANDIGRGSAGAGNGLGGSYAPPGTTYGPAEPSKPGDTGPAQPPPPHDPAPSAPLDWRAYLQNWGFPQDVVDELDRIFRTYPDSGQAGAAGLAYIRGTDWYKTTFPGIQQGIALGLISDEQGYRSYTNQLNDIYQRYYGRAVTGAEVSQALQAGHQASWLNARFSGQAYIAANKNDIQYDLGAFDPQGQATDSELQALGDQQAGLDNVLGPGIQRRLDQAKQRLQTIMGGTLANPNLALNKAGRLTAPSIGGGTTAPDYAS